jgi:hypothetical protein
MRRSAIRKPHADLCAVSQTIDQRFSKLSFLFSATKGADDASTPPRECGPQSSDRAGDVAYLGASHEEVQESWARLHRHSGILTDDDADGEVELTPKSGVSIASIWVAVDLASGDVVTVSPDTSKRRFPDALALEVVAGNRGIAADRGDVELLLHRPGLGVWFGKGLDGGHGDDSLHADGKLRVDVGAFRPLRAGGPAAPTTHEPGDRLLAIDLQHLDATSVELE